MSNPISDDADYFNSKHQGFHRPGAPKPLNMRLNDHTPSDLTSPTSPANRRRHTQQVTLDGNSRAKWQNLVHRLSAFQGPQDNNDKSDEGPHRSLWDMQSQSYSGPLGEDDSLPTPEQCYQENEMLEETHQDSETNEEGERTNFFERPFDQEVTEVPLPEPEPVHLSPKERRPMMSDSQVSTPQLSTHSNRSKRNVLSAFLSRRRSSGDIYQDGMVMTPTQSLSPARHSSQPAQEESRARANWGKTFDKLKLVSGLNSAAKNKEQHLAQPSYPLVPFYPPAFAVPYIGFARDEKGRRPPPILFDLIGIAVTDSWIDPSAINRQWVFRIELSYGEVKWVIKRTIYDFLDLHLKLRLKERLTSRAPPPPSFPNQLKHLVNAFQTRVQNMGKDDDEEKDENWRNSALRRRKALDKYLKELVARSHLTIDNYYLCEFLEISAISMLPDMGWKGKEGYLENKIHFVKPTLCQAIRINTWTDEWVILRDSYIAFLQNLDSTTPSDVLLLDKSFTVISGGGTLLGKYHHHHIRLMNGFRKVEIKATSKRSVDDWMHQINKVHKESPWVQNHRFGSFAPIRNKARVKWFVDGQDYFDAVAEALLAAKKEIYIEDWWLSPELYLRRPPEENEEFRIDRLLLKKAREGVMIYIVVYKEMSLALTINSEHTKIWLQNLHPNIIVQRHPDHGAGGGGVLFWAHHEKMVVVDNRIAFIGGLDICFGRWDTHQHRLVDHPAVGHEKETFPGQDYSNPRVKDFMNVTQYGTPLVDKNTTPRMPWHDVSIGVVGPIARDIARHFVQRWNFIKASKGAHRTTVPFLTPKGEYVAKRDESKFEGSCRVQLLRSSAEWSQGIEREHSIYNAYVECITKAKHFVYIENQFFITATTPEDKIIKNKIGQAIVERIKLAHKKGEKFRIIVVMPLAPAFEGDFASSDAGTVRLVMHFQYASISRGDNSIIEKLKAAGIEPDQYIQWYSLRNWDKLKPNPAAAKSPIATPLTTQTSPKTEAPLSSPQHYIISKNAPAMNDIVHDHHDQSDWEGHSDDEGSMAELTKESTNRDSVGNGHARGNSSEIRPSIDSVLSPAAPAATQGDAANEISSVNGSTKESTELADDRLEYVSEQLYIHTKLMIVDDRIVIIGSANLNDRSQLGNRDSEIAMLIEDTDTVPSKMNGKEYKASRFAHTLRMQLFKEHLGLLKDHDMCGEDVPKSDLYDDELLTPNTKDKVVPDAAGVLTRQSSTFNMFDNFRYDSKLDAEDQLVLDPLADSFYLDIWRSAAMSNTEIYRDTFRCVPDDNVLTFEDHRKFIPDSKVVPIGHIADPANMTGQAVQERLKRVQGHLVMFPKDYLKNENMVGSYIKETVTPMVIFT
ncbi:hypothetical protein INT44_008944 [Umbelopsis vinacea]|uniref:Phospholipase n=1 Tax=Umbelopsis vinacea TaxID=44442 RepID=A0A8H7Q111_9FUNG|nr:hypothetical protein INT44_008944 [Umbelopsis vinacea]